MKNNLYRIFFVFIFAFQSLIIFQDKVFAIGMRTEPIIIKDAMRGQVIDAQMVLINNENKDVTYSFVSSGQTNSWVTFHDKDNELVTQVNLSPKSRISATARIKIPSNTSNGNYTGSLAIVYMPPQTAQSGKTAIQQRIDRLLSITVTDKENIQFDASIMPLSYTLSPGDPLSIQISYDNQGNVDIKPNAQLKIVQNDKTIYNAIFPYPDGQSAIAPLTQKNIPVIQWDSNGQAQGSYQASVSILNKDQVIKESAFDFQISNAKNTDMSGIIAFLNKNSQWLLLALALTVFIVANLVRSIRRHRLRLAGSES